jgi:hypothetical protein
MHRPSGKGPGYPPAARKTASSSSHLLSWGWSCNHPRPEGHGQEFQNPVLKSLQYWCQLRNSGQLLCNHSKICLFSDRAGTGCSRQRPDILIKCCRRTTTSVANHQRRTGQTGNN